MILRPTPVPRWVTPVLAWEIAPDLVDGQEAELGAALGSTPLGAMAGLAGQLHWRMADPLELLALLGNRDELGAKVRLFRTGTWAAALQAYLAYLPFSGETGGGVTLPLGFRPAHGWQLGIQLDASYPTDQGLLYQVGMTVQKRLALAWWLSGGVLAAYPISAGTWFFAPTIGTAWRPDLRWGLTANLSEDLPSGSIDALIALDWRS